MELDVAILQGCLTASVVLAVGCLMRCIVQPLLQLLVTKRFLQNTTIPGPEPSHWLLGNAETLLSDQAPLRLAAWTNKYGPIYKLQLNTSPCVVLTDPAAVHQLIRWPSAADYLTKQPDLYRALELATQPQVHNILTSKDDEYWKAVRQATAPCFSISNLKQAFPWLMTLCQKAVKYIHQQQPLAAAAVPAPADGAAVGAEINVADLAKRFTSDVMGSLLLNEDLGGMNMTTSEDRWQYLPAFSLALEEVHKNYCNPFRSYMFWDADAIQGQAALKAHDHVITEKLQAVIKAAPPEHTIIAHLLGVRLSSGKPLSLAQLKAEVSMFMGAGFETTSHAISWALALLATHPEVQQTVVAELAAAGLAPQDDTAAAAAAAAAVPAARAAASGTSSCGPPRAAEWSDLSVNLPYLSAVMKEVLRLFSPASLGTIRMCHKEVQVLGHKLPKGTWVIVPVYAVGVSQHLYGDTAECFLPERWLDQQQAAHVRQLRAAHKQTAHAGGGCSSTVEGARLDGVDSAGTFLHACQKDLDGGICNEISGSSRSRFGSSSTTGGPAAAFTAAGEAASALASGGRAVDSLAFSVGPRDCIGQALAKLEMQSILATLVGHFKLHPGQQLAARLAAATGPAAAGGCEPGGGAGGAPAAARSAAVVRVLKDNIEYHVTLQPRGGEMMLRLTPRY